AGDAAAPATASQPFAGQELTIFSAQHHAAYVKDVYAPLFSERTGARVNWIEVGGGDVEAKYAVFVASQDSSADVLIAWEAMNAKYGPTLFEDITGSADPALVGGLTPASKRAFTFLDKQVGMPLDTNMAIFMWNHDLYQAAGLDPTMPPQSWSEFVEHSKKLTGNGKYATLFTMGDANSGFVSFISIYNSTGGTLLSPDLRTLTIDDAYGLMAMEAIHDIFAVSKIADPAGVTVASSIEQGKIFRAGNMGHYFAFPNHFVLAETPDQSQIVGKARTGIIPGMALRSASVNGLEGYAINRFSSNKELGMAFLNHMVSPDVQKLVALGWGRPPSVQAIFDDAEVVANAPQFAAVREQTGYPSPRYGSPYYTDLATVVVEQMLAMIDGRQSPAETVTIIQTNGQKVIDDYWTRAG
ncbi:MAG: extracellular solute-binding protein, partial [Oscillochloris sp.]|nr:extracellular solute-binding protein [Oscillochloris sp.]